MAYRVSRSSYQIFVEFFLEDFLGRNRSGCRPIRSASGLWARYSISLSFVLAWLVSIDRYTGIASVDGIRWLTWRRYVGDSVDDYLLIEFLEFLTPISSR